MTANEVSDQASEQLARRLQEEEDLLVAFQLQEQFNVTVGQFPIQNIIPSRHPHEQSHSVLCVTSDDEGNQDNDDEDIRELSFVSLSDVDSDQSTPSPVRNQNSGNTLNTAFSMSIGSSVEVEDEDDDDVIILDDSVVEDERPSRSNTDMPSDDDNIVLTVGRATRSQTRNHSNTISITNNNLSPPNSTRSRTRTSSGNTRSRSRGDRRSTSSRSPHSRKSPQPSSSTSSISDTRPQRSSRRQPVPDSSTSNSDNQPSTSTGRRAPPQNRGFRNRGTPRSPPQMSITSRVIINGVPLHHSQFSSSQHFLNHLQQFSSPFAEGLWWRGNDSMTYEDMIALDDANTLMPGQGLSKQDISHNTVTKPFNKAEGSADSCNICLTEFDQGEKVRTLPCFHLFHLKCIDNWLNRKPECPVCRLKVGH